MTAKIEIETDTQQQAIDYLKKVVEIMELSEKTKQPLEMLYLADEKEKNTIKYNSK